MMVQPVAERYTGAAVKRVEDPRILSGRGNYVDDIKLPNMAYAAFLRSPIAHARITGIETSEARRAPGVLAVYTGVELELVLTRGRMGLRPSSPENLHSTPAWPRTKCGW